MTALELAARALTEALIEDPFYMAITDDFVPDVEARKGALNLYFEYSLREAQRTGRCVVAATPAVGAAAWLLPRSEEVEGAERAAKRAFLSSVLGPRGMENHHQMVQYMAPLAAKVVPTGAWYLSIVGISPAAQGRGLGAALLAGPLQEAVQSGVPCYLETFSQRNLKFYERLGFLSLASHVEPVTSKEYVVMLRPAL